MTQPYPRPDWLFRKEAGLSYDTPRLIGDGPVVVSTSLEVMPRWKMIWDTNGYYRELGVRFDATRREIKEAYQAKKGWRSTRLTYIVSQLLDSEIRARYDSTPLGSFLMDDFIIDRLRKERVRESAELRRLGMTEDAELVELENEEWERNLSQKPRTVASRRYSAEEIWPWAYYLWGSESQDTARLRQWQELLISVLGGRKEHHEIAVGFIGDMGSWGVKEVGYRLVVFLGDDEQPTEALAQQAASRVVEHNDIKEKTWLNQPISAVAQKPPRKPARAQTLPVPSSSD